MTPTREVFIEDLHIGDRVETVSGKARAVKWIGRHAYKRNGSSWKDAVVPIHISQHALGHKRPHWDLHLSPGHALFIDGVGKPPYLPANALQVAEKGPSARALLRARRPPNR